MDHPATMFLSWNIAYLLSVLLLPPNGSHGLPGSRDLFLNCIRTGLVLALVHHAIICCSDLPVPSVWQLVLICLVVPPWLFTSRLLTTRLVRRLSDERRVAFVGDSPTLRTLRRTMERDRTSRTVLLGSFAEAREALSATWTTDAYRDLVNKYMMRLYAKPGITGWAQVNGCRGETKTTDDMVRRIQLDIWYINHWSLALDLRIIWMTVRNMLGRDKGNAY